MRIIDLLNKIANKEITPYKFKYDNLIFTKNEHGIYIDNEGDDFFTSLCTDFSNLHAEIEIIQSENNKIDKLITWFSVDRCGSDNSFMNFNFEEFYNKINELVDKINYLESEIENYE